MLNWFLFVFYTVWDSDFFLRVVTCLRYDLFNVDSEHGFMRFLRSLTRKWTQLSTAVFELGSPIPHSVTLTVHPCYIESDTENKNLHVAKRYFISTAHLAACEWLININKVEYFYFNLLECINLLSELFLICPLKLNAFCARILIIAWEQQKKAIIMYLLRYPIKSNSEAYNWIEIPIALLAILEPSLIFLLLIKDKTKHVHS